MIPAGRYTARPVSVGIVDPKGDGRDQVLIEFEIKDGRTILWFGSLNDNARGDVTALDITIEALRALGWEGSNIAEIDFPKGAEATITIVHEVWKGKTRPKIVSVDKSALEKYAVPQDRAQELAGRLAGRVAGIRGRNARGSNGRRQDDGDMNYDDQEHAD